MKNHCISILLSLQSILIGPKLSRGMVVNQVATRRTAATSQDYAMTCRASTASAEDNTDFITIAEEELRQAMLDSDVDALDRLLSDDLVFTNHIGVKMNKQDDLNAHRLGMVDIDTIELSDMQVSRVVSDVGLVTVAAHMIGSFGGESFEDTLRFTRVWQKAENKWKLVTAHSSVVEARLAVEQE